MRTKPIKDTEGILIYIGTLPQGGTVWHVRPPKGIRHYYKKRLVESNQAIPITNEQELIDLILDMSQKKITRLGIQKSG